MPSENKLYLDVQCNFEKAATAGKRGLGMRRACSAGWVWCSFSAGCSYRLSFPVLMCLGLHTRVFINSS